MAEKRTLPLLSSFFKPKEPVSDADPALADMPELDWANSDSMDVAGPGPLPPANPTVRYNSFPPVEAASVAGRSRCRQ